MKKKVLIVSAVLVLIGVIIILIMTSKKSNYVDYLNPSGSYVEEDDHIHADPVFISDQLTYYGIERVDEDTMNDIMSIVSAAVADGSISSTAVLDLYSHDEGLYIFNIMDEGCKAYIDVANGTYVVVEED